MNEALVEYIDSWNFHLHDWHVPEEPVNAVSACSTAAISRARGRHYLTHIALLCLLSIYSPYPYHSTAHLFSDGEFSSGSTAASRVSQNRRLPGLGESSRVPRRDAMLETNCAVNCWRFFSLARPVRLSESRSCYPDCPRSLEGGCPFSMQWSIVPRFTCGGTRPVRPLDPWR